MGLPAIQRGAHMSRFEEAVNEAIAAAERAPRPIVEIAAGHRRRHPGPPGGLLGEVHLRATLPLRRTAPVSGVATEEHYILHAIAAATPAGVAHVVGVSVEGMNACPCAQTLLREQAEPSRSTPTASTRTRSSGSFAWFRSRPTTSGPAERSCSAPATGDRSIPLTLVAIVEEGMSSEIYELMKRTDERYVVDRAHRRPRFVEDSVREMIRGVLERVPELPDDAFCSATQLNLETIHSHDVEASHEATLGTIRAEIGGLPTSASDPSLGEWLRRTAGGARAAVISAVGVDRPGIVAALTDALLTVRGNLSDCRAALLRGSFATVLAVSVPDDVDDEAIRAAIGATATNST